MLVLLTEPAYPHMQTSINKQNILHNRVVAGVSTNQSSRILSTRMRSVTCCWQPI